MFEQRSPRLDDLDATGALAFAVDQRSTADRAEARLLGVAAHWADLHPVLEGDPDGFRVPGMEQMVPLAGVGTPEVAEFAPAELAAALGMSTSAGQQLVGDALELRHRLPRLWARVQDGTLQAWRGRQIAAHTRSLSPEAAGWVDGQVAPFAHKIGLARTRDLVEAALVRFDPNTAAKHAEATAGGRGVWVSDQMIEGTRSISIQADALDATAFDHTINAIADTLAALGDADRKDLRRAKAVGVIADPQATLDLLGGAGDGDSGRSPRAHVPGKPKVTLYVHLHEDAITSGAGVGRVEGLGPACTATLADWAGRSDLTIKPVLDLANRASVDAYEVPDRMRETVFLRNPCCPFPWCTNRSRNKDTDHVIPYTPPEEGGPPADGGPPGDGGPLSDGEPSGQTTTHNLAPPCRRHHRLKTHGGWSYAMPEPGTYLWRSPQGRRYLVDHTGTSPLADDA